MVYARFTPTLTNVTTNKLTQWDYGRILRIEGLKLPTAVRIDFGISGSQTTISRIGITKDGVTDAAIPDSLLEQSKNLVAYVYVNDTKEGKTVRTINIPLEARAEPEEHDSPESKALFAEAIEMINDVAVRAENAEIAAKEHADSAWESLEATQQISSNFNETAANAVKAVIDAGTSQIQAVNNTKTKALEAIQAESAAQLEYIQAAGEVIVNTAAIAEQNAKNVLANAIKGHLNGEVVVADDVSLIEHEMAVKVVCPDGIDPATVNVRRCGKNLIPYPFASKTQVFNGITFTDNGDGSVTIEGTATGDGISFMLVNTGAGSRECLPAGTYRLSCPEIANNKDVFLSLFYYDDNETATFAGTAGKNNSFTLEKEQYYGLYFRVYGGVTINKVRAYPQLEIGSVATEYEPYKGTEHTTSSDGTVSGMMSTSPNMTILTDTEGVVIDCEYIKDTNKVIRKLADALGVVI